MSTEDIGVAAERPASIFESDLPLQEKLERARTELLDLSARNRLLNIPRSAKSAKTLEIVDERAREVFRLLVRDQRPFTFLPGRAAPGSDQVVDEGGEEIAELAQPDDDGFDERGIANRHADTKLQTRLTPAGLQKRLLDMYHDARTLEEEQGVNILFLALGTLKWVDPGNANNVRYAPLILVPVALERGNAAEKFKLRWRQEDLAPNLSLEAYLDRIHGLKLPTFEADDDFDISAYVAAVGEAVSAKEGWAVAEDDIVLGFFSFAKFLMYRDLDAETWPASAKLDEHALIRSLVSEGFRDEAPLLPEEAAIDPQIPPSDMLHIVDSDSSQTLAVHEVRRGRNLVIQGPPGTGKSQTIANVIASAIADGKTVLFVAEKMAALDVVKRRLDNTGVGDACLELHSNKANKRALLEDLRRTWELGVPRGDGLATLSARLTDARDQLNAHADRLHTPLGRAGYTPYQVIGHLTRLRQSGQRPTDLTLEEPASWSAEELRERTSLLLELAERVTDIGIPAQHIWRGVGLSAAMPPDVDRLLLRISGLCDRLAAMDQAEAKIASLLEQDAPETLDELDGHHVLARRLAEAPDLEPAVLGAQEWSVEADAIVATVEAGDRYNAIATRLANVFVEEAWSADLSPTRNALAALPSGLTLQSFAVLDDLVGRLPTLQAETQRLAAALGRDAAPRNISEIAELVKVGERVAAAPDADPQALASDLWDSGIERAADLASAVEVLEAARAEIGSELSEAAWSADLGAARQTLAAHGTGFFRFLSSEWRAADRLVRSFLAQPKMPLERRLSLLDCLKQGQMALALVASDTGFARSAFGTDWRGERSSAGPLLALVEWMRSLRGLGAEPRLIVARGPDKALIRVLATRVSDLAAQMREPLGTIWHDLESCRDLVFGDASGVEWCDLSAARDALSKIKYAHDFYASIARQVDPDLDQRRENLALLDGGQAAVSEIAARNRLGQALFGVKWRGTDSDWTALRAAAEWVRANLDIHELASRVPDRQALLRQADDAIAKRDQFVADLADLLHDLRTDSSAVIDIVRAQREPRAQLTKALVEWRDNGERLSKWVVFRTQAERAKALGLADLVSRLHDGRLSPEATLSHFEMSYFEVIFATQVHAVPELAQFDGDLQAKVVRDFVDLDRQRIRHAALEVVQAHHKRIPPSAGGALGPLGILKGEIARKRGHMPIRQLMQRAAPAIQALKPVLMMSPLSVAQFLSPGALTFDLLVMDEASQIQPVDALGAIARCRQVVVVGDPHQLPPTTFFSKMTSDGGASDEEDSGAGVADIESILGLFTARGLQTRMLRWHYRSRHQSLIAVSNRQFYEGKLYIVPSPYTAQSGLGLRFHHIENGIFETGTSRTNPVEAKEVARAIVAHAMTYPGQSLGVVAFSAAQRRAIFDQLELLRRKLSEEHEAFFQAHPTEPFFIKNLENVQGDERDVIFISVGYGPTAHGSKPPMRFGPLGQDGGERRLNVLISRAKRRCEIFSSMTDEDIEPEFASSRKGVFAFKLFMHFARTGRMTLAEPTGSDRDEVFEEEVARALHARGYQVHRKVGVSGIFIDIAIADPDHPNRYLLAIECDGASYYGARSARDRDRLRQSVLEDHGWIVHRIWSTDWFRRPKEQMDRLTAAIEAAKLELSARDQRDRPRPTIKYEIQSFERDDVTEMAVRAFEESTESALPYVEVELSVPAHLSCELHEAPTGAITALAEQVVAAEGPVHFDEIVARIREAWGLRRSGARIQSAVEQALAVSVRQSRVVVDDDFYALPGSEVRVRDRSAARSPTLRKPEFLPPAEIAVALVEIVSRNFGATEDQAIQAVARMLGFRATSAQIREIIAEVLQQQLEAGVLCRRDSLIDVGPNAPARERRQLEPSPLEKLVADGEHERLEFKQTLRWDVRQQVANKKLEDVVVKTIAAFANHEGGTLLIGVADDGSAVGLEADFACLGGNRDRFELHLTNLLNARFSQAFRATKVKVSFPIINETLICRVDIQPAREPIYVTLPDQSGAVGERLFVRSGNASHEIPPSQIVDFVKERFA